MGAVVLHALLALIFLVPALATCKVFRLGRRPLLAVDEHCPAYGGLDILAPSPSVAVSPDIDYLDPLVDPLDPFAIRVANIRAGMVKPKSLLPSGGYSNPTPLKKLSDHKLEPTLQARVAKVVEASELTLEIYNG